MLRQTNKNAHPMGAANIVQGTMFKTNGAWYLAAQKSKASSADVRTYDWCVHAYNKNGSLVFVAIYSDQVETTNEGYIPPCFRSANVLRAATTREKQAESILNQVASMRRFAAALAKVGY